MKKSILAFAAVIAATGSALVGKTDAKQLLVSQGWYNNQNGAGLPETTNTASALAMCDNEVNETCLYKFAEGETQPHDVIRGQLRN
ncbi:hypothetical protein PQ465_12795 [Sphingobacterium oryzagri]|uniref:Uncharacterized protein n=1 Tax=Sphingobacterium oryzagri TaxID=3025669 RepID=A0ABY7WFD2_9SPHI|nr:hypothetical protein [Sphingobacterium sp. KACC 22765]WDF67182.1 hypothetical protein PQ465_12795 [Sphingobacterium sp. KACC 22765]